MKVARPCPACGFTPGDIHRVIGVLCDITGPGRQPDLNDIAECTECGRHPSTVLGEMSMRRWEREAVEAYAWHCMAASGMVA